MPTDEGWKQAMNLKLVTALQKGLHFIKNFVQKSIKCQVVLTRHFYLLDGGGVVFHILGGC